MSKIYVFGIGGTGSRVLKSLIMLLATGVKIDADEIVPIIIDPDHAAADLTRTVKLMQDYKKIRNQIDFNSSSTNTFFKTDINLSIIPSVTMPLRNTQNVRFKEYIELELMKDNVGNYNSNYALASMLFSNKNLNSDMDVGFKGNPNIGSVVLNQFASSSEFIDFAASFNQGDRIFIISSIFGGTGASGFPLLLKNLRSISNEIAGNGNIKNAPIGAVTVMPYFDVAPDNNTIENKRSQIDSSSFISKTKAALSYYDKNMTEANALYYIADDISKQYTNSEGGTTQQNDAHFVELAAALSIIDFAEIPDSNLITLDTHPQNTIYKEFGIKNVASQIIFGDLCSKTNSMIQKSMTRFVLFCKYLKEQLRDSQNQPWAIDHKFDDNFIHSTFYNSDLTAFRDDFLEWLTEMSTNKRAFQPFDLSEKKSDVYSLVKGTKPAKVLKFASNYALFDDTLNSLQKKIKTDAGKESCFIELFHNATTQLVKNKLRM